MVSARVYRSILAILTLAVGPNVFYIRTVPATRPVLDTNVWIPVWELVLRMQFAKSLIIYLTVDVKKEWREMLSIYALLLKVRF